MYTPRIGLEIHIQLATQSKAFCACPVACDAPPNTHICPVCLAYPGALPVLNARVVEFGIRLGLAVGATIHHESRFDRKNYFYPDLPKGYQITQQDMPICTGGRLLFGAISDEQSVGITRIHIEEDAAKMIHDSADETLIDFNRCGVPLLELVTEPTLRSGEDAAACVAALQRLVRWMGISGGAMELGELRCDVNISIEGERARTEIKNLNSLRAIRSAAEYDFARHTNARNNGISIAQDTRVWDENAGCTRSMREKQTAAEYHYMPEPDLLPLRITDKQIEAQRRMLPEYPRIRARRLTGEFGISPEDAVILCSERALSEYFLDAATYLENDTKRYILLASWITGETLHAMRERNRTIQEFPIEPERLAALVRCIADGIVSSSAAKKVFAVMLLESSFPEHIIDGLGLRQVSDTQELTSVLERIIRENPDAVAQFRAGKIRASDFLLGKAMQAMRGKANPGVLRALLDELLERA